MSVYKSKENENHNFSRWAQVLSHQNLHTYITLHYSTLHYNTVHYIPVQYITVNYITCMHRTWCTKSYVTRGAQVLSHSYVVMVLRVVHAALKKSNIVSNLIRTPDELGLVQGGPTHDEIGLGHPGVSFTSPKSLD